MRKGGYSKLNFRGLHKVKVLLLSAVSAACVCAAAVNVQANDSSEAGEQPITFTDTVPFEGSSDFSAVVSPAGRSAMITNLTINHGVQERKTSKYTVFSGGYYVDESADRIYMNEPTDEAIVAADMSDGQQYVFRYDRDRARGERFVPVSDEEAQSRRYMHVRIVGSFESAMVSQRKYDGISGATSGVTANKNSNVEVQAAFTDSQEAVPSEDEWKPFHEWTNVQIDREKTKVVVPEETGMSGVYSTYDSSLTLSGTPEQPGEYRIHIEVTDLAGRRAVSNELPFRIFSQQERLADHLKESNARQMQDGKYIWDMDPWYIPYFGGENETVTVPSGIKAWYGSHTSGTYGELGMPVEPGSEESTPVQTLIIGENTDLTLVNMKVKSSVTMIVRNGGKLNLHDSSVYGKIIVEDGGRFQMNYDSFGQKYLTGAQINGQVELREGAVLEKSLIYSNTNFLTDGAAAKRNVKPVVTVTGNARIEGNVYIRGDESPTGKDPHTGETYTGQPAMAVVNAVLEIPAGSTLGVYGGGRISTTTHGGAALVLDQGTVSGEGNLIAVGGNGDQGRGGNGVSGSGRIDAAKAYLHGGNTHHEGMTGGKAYSGEINIADDTIGTAVDGIFLSSSVEHTQPAYWSDVTAPPSPEAAPFGEEKIVRREDGKEQPDGDTQTGDDSARDDADTQGGDTQTGDDSASDNVDTPGGDSQTEGQPDGDTAVQGEVILKDGQGNFVVFPDGTDISRIRLDVREITPDPQKWHDKAAGFEIELKDKESHLVKTVLSLTGNKKVTAHLSGDFAELVKSGAKLYFIDEDGQAKERKAHITDGQVVFETDHFSTWVVGTPKENTAISSSVPDSVNGGKKQDVDEKTAAENKADAGNKVYVERKTNIVPKTGDTEGSSLLILAVVFITAGSLSVYQSMKKMKK